MLEGIVMQIGFQDPMKSNPLMVIYLLLVEVLCLENPPSKNVQLLLPWSPNKLL